LICANSRYIGNPERGQPIRMELAREGKVRLAQRLRRDTLRDAEQLKVIGALIQELQALRDQRLDIVRLRRITALHLARPGWRPRRWDPQDHRLRWSDVRAGIDDRQA